MERLQRLLLKLQDLNLTSKNIRVKGVKADGGSSDVYIGFYMDGDKMIDIAVKRLRVNLHKDSDLAKVCFSWFYARFLLGGD